MPQLISTVLINTHYEDLQHIIPHVTNVIVHSVNGIVTFIYLECSVKEMTMRDG